LFDALDFGPPWIRCFLQTFDFDFISFEQPVRGAAGIDKFRVKVDNVLLHDQANHGRIEDRVRKVCFSARGG
jgi:hypothetical protein